VAEVSLTKGSYRQPELGRKARIPHHHLVEARILRLSRIQLRSNLRTLLILILVIALWLGWRVNKAHRQSHAIAQVEKFNGYVRFDYEYVSGKEIPNSEPKAPKWLRRHLGDDYFREVSLVTYVDQPLSDATLAPLTDLNAIEELRFLTRLAHEKAPVAPPPGLERLTESGLSRLEGLTRLRRAKFQNMKLTGSMLRHLSRSIQLEELKVIEGDRIKGGITDEGLPPFSAMTRLRVLSLWCHRITGSCLEPLRGSRSLEELEFSGSPISTAGFENIGAITNLKSLYFNQVDVSDRHLSDLRHLTGLTRLTLDNNRSKITDAGLVHLSGMTQLEWLDLTGCKIAGRGLASLKNMTQLKRLCLGWTGVDDPGLEVIAGFVKLECLELHQTKITDGGLVHLRGLKNLRELSLIGTAVTPQARDELKTAIPTLSGVR
jgi:Leucine-rich repeat (LRR) protein